MRKGRGRPPSQETLARRHVLTVLSGTITQDEKLIQDNMLCNLAKAEKEILSHYKSYPTIAKSHIFEMHSLDHESMIGHEKSIIQKDKAFINAAKVARRLGGRHHHQTREIISKSLIENNKILLSKMKPFGRLSKHFVAKKIHSEWTYISPKNKLQGEENLKSRGVKGFGLDSNKKLCVKTIERYIDIGVLLTH